MQTIQRAASNTVVFTLTERVTLASPYFLMRLQSRSTNETKRVIITPNTSSFTTRYDQFTLIENNTENLTNSTIKLFEGDWNYEIYEQASASNLLETNATTLLESGILRVLATANTYKDPEQTETFIDA